jgi:hypothetical protein
MMVVLWREYMYIVLGKQDCIFPKNSQENIKFFGMKDNQEKLDLTKILKKPKRKN